MPCTALCWGCLIKMSELVKKRFLQARIVVFIYFTLCTKNPKMHSLISRDELQKKHSALPDHEWLWEWYLEWARVCTVTLDRSICHPALWGYMVSNVPEVSKMSTIDTHGRAWGSASSPLTGAPIMVSRHHGYRYGYSQYRQADFSYDLSPHIQSALWSEITQDDIIIIEIWELEVRKEQIDQTILCYLHRISPFLHSLTPYSVLYAKLI